MLLCHDIKDFPTIEMVQEGFIDIWWIKRDGGLLLLISHLLQKHRVWSKCALRLHLVMESGINPESVKLRMHALLRTININASVEEVLLVDPESMLPYTQSTMLRKISNMISAESHVDLSAVSDESHPLLGDGGEPQVARSHSGRRERGHKEEKPHKKERGHKKKGAKEGAGGALSDTEHDGESRSISQSVTQSQSLTHNSLPTLVTHMPIA